MTTKRNVYGTDIEDWTENRRIPGTGILQDYGVDNAESYIVTDKKGRTAIMKIILGGAPDIKLGIQKIFVYLPYYIME